jgi:hypothetical protein
MGVQKNRSVKTDGPHLPDQHNRESITAELRRLAALLGKSSLSRMDIAAHGRVNFRCVIKNFGSLAAALEAAGLSSERLLTNAELLNVVADMWVRSQRDFGRSPRLSDFARYEAPVSWWKITRRFGSWRKALLAARRLSERDDVKESERTHLPEPPRSEPRTPRTNVSVRTRFLVFQRDLYKCRICNNSGVKLELDHVVPVSRGGSNELDNLQTLCVACNRGKQDSLQ